MKNISVSTEKKILEAATRIFLKRGKHGARMEDIAREAGLNKALLHYYFRTKEHLYREVFQNEIRQFFKELTAAIPREEDFKKFMKKFIYFHIQHIQKNPQVVRFLIWEFGQDTSLIQETAKELKESLQIKLPDFWVEKIEKAVQDKIIRPIDPTQFILSVLGMNLFVFVGRSLLEAVFTDFDFQDAAFIEKRKAAIFDLLWNGLKISS